MTHATKPEHSLNMSRIAKIFCRCRMLHGYGKRIAGSAVDEIGFRKQDMQVTVQDSTEDPRS